MKCKVPCPRIAQVGGGKVFMGWEGDFLGALDGQQVLVVEGSGVAGTPGGVLPRFSVALLRCT